jgi:uncharacterized lipoprotein YddW (UPF0748 family)
MRRILISFNLLFVLGIIFTFNTAQAANERGIFLASTGPTTEYAKVWWWESPKAVTDLLDRLEKAGFNEVYPQVFGHGNYFFKTSRALFKNGVIPDRIGFDALAELITQAHARKMKVIPYFPFLVAGGKIYVKRTSAGNKIPHMDWYNVDNKGERGSTLAFDPSNPGVKKYLQNMVEDLMVYDMDGLMLDYIRYTGAQMGYTACAREKFKKKFNVDPLDLINHNGKFNSNVVYCLRPTFRSKQSWYLSSLLTTMNKVNVPFKVINEEAGHINKLPENSILLIASYYKMSDQTINEIEKFVANGGNVVFLEAPVLSVKTYSKKLVPLLGLTAKGRYFKSQEKEVKIATTHPVTHGLKNGKLNCSGNTLVEKITGTKILANFGDGRPAVVLNNYKKGKCIVFNFNMILKYSGGSGIKLLKNSLVWLLKINLSKEAVNKGHSAKLYQAWNQWRSDQVTEIVKMVRTTMKKHKPSLTLGAATTPHERDNQYQVFQDWKNWVNKGDIDYSYPMDYFDSNMELKSALQEQCQGVPKSKIIPLLGLYTRKGKKTVAVQPEKLASQLKLLKKLGFTGVGFFSQMRFSKEIEKSLEKSW